MDISKLLADLAAQGVETFEGYGVKVSFHKRTHAPVVDAPSQTPIEPQTSIPIDPGLAATIEAEMNPDKALLWSAPGGAGPDEVETPLTGELA